MDDVTLQLVDMIRRAAADRTALCIRAGGSKDFYGNIPRGELLDPRLSRGVVDYDPAELVLTARAGTSLAEVEALLLSRGQMLGFEPPHFGHSATVGGCVAAGLAGPRAGYAGAGRGLARDFVLGARLVDGRGRVLKFGGTVIKNVAGYDVARVLAGSLGILGVITEVSLKVVPRPPSEVTLRFEANEGEALRRMNEWGRQPLPISGAAWESGVLTVRLSGPPTTIAGASRGLGGEVVADGGRFWTGLREHETEFFAGDMPVWRIALPSNAPSLASNEPQLIDWGGAVRWLRSTLPNAELRGRIAALGGIATLFRGGDRAGGVFARLPPPLARIQAAIKAEFDPSGILNPGRLVEEL
jgi:glycolate oxidase FAD binding subunit